ncbi:phosphotransferase [Sphingobium sp. HBC34]|uniref:Phosphotransferase n=1 Tax=Sphingobium cyanobacteriorum TaxID=3063954 RepID=A0ABT8ZPG3_9SPHN|nr:phosphotransferase [Sphingobium sp. HBC34]MDO7836386.1 phosphotransferase [Sphingobium sp. HBC34]
MNTSAVSVYPLPLSPEDITADWLSVATGHRIESAEVVDVILGTSTKIRVRVRSDTLPETLIVKGGFEAHSPMMKEMYANEIAFYRLIAPALPIHTPTCWFAGSDPDSHQSIVIMDDLVARGVTFLHAQRPERYEAVERRLGDLARFHAASWNDPELAPGGRWGWLVGRFSDWSMVYAERYLKPDMWRHYCESPRGAAVSVRLHDMAWMRRALKQFAEIEQQGPLCIIHGDTHLGNLYVEADGTPGFLDSQPSKASPFMEVVYHVVCALDVADRKAWEQDLLRHYLSKLAENGVAPPGWDEAWLQYRQFIGYGYFIFLINEIRFQTEAINTAYAARYGAAMLDHDVLNLVGH